MKTAPSAAAASASSVPTTIDRPRARKIGIVAVARRLMIDLWRYLEQGVLPEGAVLKPLASG